jgi:putative holliday junction resolvase
MRHLALDVGDERIGVALSDLTGLMARPLETIARRAGSSSFLRLVELITQHNVGTIVVGLPLTPKGEEGAQVRSVQAYVRGLGEYTTLPIVYWDERYSTHRAQEILISNRHSRRRRQQATDAVAAAVILQEYLDSQSGGKTL